MVYTASVSSSDIWWCPVSQGQGIIFILPIQSAFSVVFFFVCVWFFFCCFLFFFWPQLFYVLENAVVIARQLLMCSTFVGNSLEYQCHVTLRYRLFKMLEYVKKQNKTKNKTWETAMSKGDCWRSTRGLMGLRALLVKWCPSILLGKCCQWLWAEWWTASLIFMRELGRGWSRGERYSWRRNCTAPPLTPHTRSWVMLGAVTSQVSGRALKLWSLAALAGLDDHVGELLNFRGATHVVEDGKGLQVLRNTAGWGGRFRVQSVVEAQQLKEGEEGDRDQQTHLPNRFKTYKVFWHFVSPSCGWYLHCVGKDRDQSRSWHSTLLADGSISSPNPAGN